MASHLRYNAETIDAKTTQGAFTRDLLDLNDPKLVQQRKLMIKMIQICQANLEESKQMKKVINRKLKKGTISASHAEKQIVRLEGLVAEMEETLKQLIGTQF
ncbi:MAG TPA: hypothetical protein VHB01_00530 [Nitrosospira sp.]|nr:hypothetical protein [Nitrosospira sp.]